jgi:hypothetical protein
LAAAFRVTQVEAHPERFRQSTLLKLRKVALISRFHHANVGRSEYRERGVQGRWVG